MALTVSHSLLEKKIEKKSFCYIRWRFWDVVDDDAKERVLFCVYVLKGKSYT